MITAVVQAQIAVQAAVAANHATENFANVAIVRYAVIVHAAVSSYAMVESARTAEGA